MPVKKPAVPVVHPKVDPELMAIVVGIYARWTPEEFGHAIGQYRREHNLIIQKTEIKKKIKQLNEELEQLVEVDQDSQTN